MIISCILVVSSPRVNASASSRTIKTIGFETLLHLKPYDLQGDTKEWLAHGTPEISKYAKPELLLKEMCINKTSDNLPKNLQHTSFLKE